MGKPDNFCFLKTKRISLKLFRLFIRIWRQTLHTDQISCENFGDENLFVLYLFCVGGIGT